MSRSTFCGPPAPRGGPGNAHLFAPLGRPKSKAALRRHPKWTIQLRARPSQQVSFKCTPISPSCPSAFQAPERMVVREERLQMEPIAERALGQDPPPALPTPPPPPFLASFASLWATDLHLTPHRNFWAPNCWPSIQARRFTKAARPRLGRSGAQNGLLCTKLGTASARSPPLAQLAS